MSGVHCADDCAVKQLICSSAHLLIFSSAQLLITYRPTDRPTDRLSNQSVLQFVLGVEQTSLSCSDCLSQAAGGRQKLVDREADQGANAQWLPGRTSTCSCQDNLKTKSPNELSSRATDQSNNTGACASYLNIFRIVLLKVLVKTFFRFRN